MKKQILYLATLAALTTGGAVLINNFNASYLTTSVAHAGTAGINMINDHGTYSISYWDDNGQPKIDVLGSYSDLLNDFNSATVRDENNPQNNTGFNVDQYGKYWYKNYDTHEDKSIAQSEIDEAKNLDNPYDYGNKPINASDTSTTTTNNTSTDKQSTTTNPVTANQKQINKDRAALKRVQKELKHSKNKRAKQLLQKQIRHLENNLKKLSK